MSGNTYAIRLFTFSGEMTLLIKTILQAKQTILHVYGNIFILPCQQLFEKSDVIVVCNNSIIFQIYDNNTECNIPKKFARKKIHKNSCQMPQNALQYFSKLRRHSSVG